MMSIAHIAYLISLLTTLVMTGAALTAPRWEANRAADAQAYATFAGLGAAGAIVAYHWGGSGRRLWVFLASMAVCVIAGSRGLPVFWFFMLGYGVAGGIGVWIAARSSGDDRPHARRRGAHRQPAEHRTAGPWHKG